MQGSINKELEELKNKHTQTNKTITESERGDCKSWLKAQYSEN